VHEGKVYFTNFSDGRLYRQDGIGEAPVPLTPEAPVNPRTKHKPVIDYADGLIDAARKRWVGVLEDWSAVDDSSPDPCQRQPEHRIVAIDFAKDQLSRGETIANGHDFYSSPRLSPDGERLAWLEWDHPNMPWHGTTLRMVELNDLGRPIGDPAEVAGGPDVSVFQPEWSPDGNELWFVSDSNGWWNLYRYKLSNAAGTVEAVTSMEAEFGRPQWTLGQSTYAFAKGGTEVVATYSRGGLAQLAVIERMAGKLSDIKLDYTSFDSVCADAVNRVAFIGGGRRTPPSVVVHELDSGQQRVLKKANTLADDPDIARQLSDVETVTFKSGGEEAYALYYPPANGDFIGPTDEKPPLVVKSHGGPTGQASSTLDFRIQYWTSRGIAVLDVNYRGSSGFGRAYRNRLQENWGLIDVEDCINGARWLAEKDRVDGDRTVITGGSAGGYTTLAALTFHDYFSAGASHYGIGDLEALAKLTHKFESRYLDWLVGPRETPEQRQRYKDRSPINHVDRLSQPVIFFQGGQDKIVPKEQAESMVNALKKKGLPVGYLLFEEEGHGFREDDNKRRAIEAEHYFFSFVAFRSRLTFGTSVSCST